MNGAILDGFSGGGGWDEAIRMLGAGPVVSLELDRDACLTAGAAGANVIRCDITRFPVSRLAGRTMGQCWSPPCTLFSAAGSGAGVKILDELAAAVRDQFAAGRRWRRTAG